MTEDLLHTQALRQKVFQKIADEWQSKWASEKHGQEFINFDRVKNKNTFYEALKDDIDEALKAKFGLAIASEKTISKDTIRRFLDERYRYGFKDEVKNVFAIYLDYDSWEAFKNHELTALAQANLPLVIQQINVVSLLPKPNDWWHQQQFLLEENPRKKRNWKFLLATVLTIALLLGFYKAYSYWQTNRTFSEAEKEKVQLHLVAQNNSVAPCVATFAYDFSALGIDSLTAYFDYGGHQNDNKMILTEKKGSFDWNFYKPHSYSIELRHDKQIVKRIVFMLASQNWSAWYNGGGMQSPLQDNSKYWQNGMLCLKPDKLPSHLLSDYTTQFEHVSNYGVDMDDCAIEFRLKNNPSEYGISCYDVVVHLGDDNGRSIVFRFTKKGCMIERINGSTLDFSYQNRTLLEIPYIFAHWATLLVVFKNQSLSIYLDGKLLSQHPYTEKLQKLKDLGLVFKGSGMVDWVKVFDKTEKLVYQEDFNETSISKIGIAKSK